jgi:uncharacterized protein with gpF-like domain
MAPTLIQPIGPVPVEALSFFRSKGIKPSFSFLDVWNAEHAQAFTVAKAMQADVLTTLQGAVDKAIAESQTFQQFQKGLTPTLQGLGWWGRKDVVDPVTGEVVNAQLGSPRRLKTIFDANMRSARAAGQWERIDRTKKLLPYLLYQLGPSEHHRPEHAAWNGLILPVDDVFWDAHFPPNGWGCKCHVIQLSAAQAARRGGPSVRPVEQLVSYKNARTGQTLRVPKGVDPAWAFNPGKVRRAA